MKKTKEQNKKLKLFKKLVIGVGYVWTLAFLCSALFREEKRNLHLYPWTIYVGVAILVVGFAIIIYYSWLSKKVKKMRNRLSVYWQSVIFMILAIYLFLYVFWLSYMSVYYSYLACLLTGVVLGTRITNYINKKDGDE